MNMTTRFFRSRKSRGQAAVELALLGIIIVPVFLYILFIDDLLRFKLDQREAMITTGWDFTTLNYDHQSKNPTSTYIPKMPTSNPDSPSLTMEGMIQTYNRYQFSDHNVATPRFDDYKNNNTHHHLAVGAQQCWLVGGKQNQVTCKTPDINAAATYTVDLTVGARGRMQNFLQGTDTTGGLYSCTGRVGVINHWLPSGTLFFSKVELSSREYHGVKNGNINYNGDGTDSVATSINEAKTYHFPADSFAIITHPWAMTDEDDTAPTNSPRMPGSLSGQPLYDRVVQVYNSTGPTVAYAVAETYTLQAIGKGIINPLVIIDSPVGDLMMTPEVSFTKNYDPKVNGFYSSQYWDFSGNDVQKTYNKRGTWYLGSTASPP